MSSEIKQHNSNTKHEHHNVERVDKQKPSKFEKISVQNGGHGSASYIRYQNQNHKIYESYKQQNTSQMSRQSRRSNLNNEEMTRYEKISQLSQRLKNIHHFYKIRIDEEKHKNTERNQVFMGIIQELQNSHNDRISALQLQISAAQEQKKQVTYVDDKMSQIKGSIDQILKQSANYKISNEKLEKEIISKEEGIRVKERILQKTKKEEVYFRNQLQNFQKVNLKENKRQQQILQMIDNLMNGQGR